MSNAGTALLDFGATPSANTSVAIVGQAGLVAATSIVEAWVEYAASVDHTADEHLVVQLRVMAGTLVDGVGFTIYGICDSGAITGKFNVNWAWV